MVLPERLVRHFGMVIGATTPWAVGGDELRLSVQLPLNRCFVMHNDALEHLLHR